jgi:hypothetical protein
VSRCQLRGRKSHLISFERRNIKRRKRKGGKWKVKRGGKIEGKWLFKGRINTQ